MTTTDGGTIPLTIELVSEADEWKVLGLTTPMAGAAIADGEKRKPAAPDDQTVRHLVNQRMRSFSQAIERNDFDGMSRVFQPLIEQKINFGNIQNTDPTFAAAVAA